MFILIVAFFFPRTEALLSSEFAQFLMTLRRLGIPHEVNHGPTKERWQALIKSAGYNITALGCTVIRVGDIEYLFSNGPVEWTEDERGIGPGGLFMFGHCVKTHRIIPRTLFNQRDGTAMPRVAGLAAMKRQHRHEWHTSALQPENRRRSSA